MKNIFAFLSLLSLVLYSCKSNESIPADSTIEKATSTIADNQLEKALLWEITGNGLTESSYLFGTIHMIDTEDYFLPEGTLSAIDNSTEVYFEIDMTEMNDISKIMPLMQKAYMNDDLTLKDLLSEEDYALVQDHFEKMNLPLFFFERIKPMFLTVFASGDINPGDLKSGKIKSYEMEFAEIAAESNKTIGGLETIEYQISIFDSIPYTAQAEMLIETIKAGDTGDDQFMELVKLYKGQDVAGLYSVMQDEESIEEYEDILLVQRNKNWIPIMSERMAQNKTFFAVGAGHLGGPMGVINLLKKAGYTMTPVNPV